jgi:hypothetical protein
MMTPNIERLQLVPCRDADKIREMSWLDVPRTKIVIPGLPSHLDHRQGF